MSAQTRWLGRRASGRRTSYPRAVAEAAPQWRLGGRRPHAYGYDDDLVARVCLNMLRARNVRRED
ncbi:MAG: hypothetical protein ACXWQR_12495, partial [Ktedonobacterales bacterium]